MGTHLYFAHLQWQRASLRQRQQAGATESQTKHSNSIWHASQGLVRLACTEEAKHQCCLNLTTACLPAPPFMVLPAGCCSILHKTSLNVSAFQLSSIESLQHTFTAAKRTNDWVYVTKNPVTASHTPHHHDACYACPPPEPRPFGKKAPRMNTQPTILTGKRPTCSCLARALP